MEPNNERISSKVFAAVIATGLMSFSGVLVETSMNIAFPTLMRDFNVSTNVVQWMTSIYLLAVSIIVPISAALKSSYKTKSLFLIANFLFLLGLIVDATAPIFPVLLLGRVIQGIGTGIALALGPTFGGIVLQALNWRWVFWFLIPLIIISLLLGIWGIEQKSAVKKVKIDRLSFIMIAIFFIGMLVGFSNLGTGQLGATAIPILIALLALALLIWRSNRIKMPILDLKLFKNHSFTGHIIGFFCIQLISLGNAFLLPNFIQLVNHNTAFLAGLIVLPAGVAGAIMGPIGGRLLDNYGARKPILFGVSLMLLETLFFAVLPNQMNNIFILIVYIIYMAGMGMILGDVMTDTLAVIDESETTQGNAILNTAQQFAGAVGTSITSAIVASSQKGTKSADLTRIGTQHAYIFLLYLVILIMALFIKYVGRRTATK
ncbi:MFS transporter [Lactobacillus crispatus]|uniref:MFS transporter n=1 Tax=Lactobacillus TaxID=1578 RepID=UPI000B5D9C09|nr:MULTISPECIES: MFS transporter [Lactobacillus]OXC46470.1 MFS transporter [Lactobacillus crispatus]OXC47515.1 MFS transporter [Lactobacillus crispatus]OXC48075.1 MFS transporter [Lactobacillus crispatus]OXC52892.1 MFS transporter [Lactobacillus crispatus]OXC53125.1 MFS transporter [Lactobacillus crispatus]